MGEWEEGKEEVTEEAREWEGGVEGGGEMGEGGSHR